MKKLILAAALAFVSLTTYAQEETTISEEVEVAIQDEFAEIESSELPEAVTASLTKDYPSATVSKVYVNEDKQFKLEVSLEDGTSGTLYADEEGNWINI